VRLLIAEHQLGQTRATVQSSAEPVAIADAAGRLLLPNAAFLRLVGRSPEELNHLADIAALFSRPDFVRVTLASLRTAHQPWRGELALTRADGTELPVMVRAEVVPGRDGAVLGFILIAIDLSDSKRADAARQHLEQSLSIAPMARESDQVVNAILTNASLAAMDITDGPGGPAVAPLLEELEVSTARATALYGQIRSFVGKA
jgi:PAS domain S-box-containing protein